jgi:prepilin-type N-terminal cleavage/methylation domain-containing protein
MKREAGFTLLEVMVSMLIGTIGLMGTIAVQQSIISASKNANDAAVAMRLASQKLEELSSRSTDSQGADWPSAVIGNISTRAGSWWQPIEATERPVPEYVDAEGVYLRDQRLPHRPQPGELGRYRWHRQWKVVNTGVWPALRHFRHRDLQQRHRRPQDHAPRPGTEESRGKRRCDHAEAA